MGRFFNKHDPSFEAFPAVVVADKTDKFGRRLGIFALFMLVLFFAISSSVQSARNGRLLEGAAKDRSSLIQDLNTQSKLILQLQNAIKEQNKILKNAGIRTVLVPGERAPTPAPGISPTPYVSTPTPEASPGSRHNPTPKPKPSPSPSPNPSPDPVTQTRRTVCELTGIGCTKENP